MLYRALLWWIGCIVRGILRDKKEFSMTHKICFAQLRQRILHTITTTEATRKKNSKLIYFLITFNIHTSTFCQNDIFIIKISLLSIRSDLIFKRQSTTLYDVTKIIVILSKGLLAYGVHFLWWKFFISKISRQARLMLNDNICRGSCRWIFLYGVMILDTSAFIAICFCSVQFPTRNLILNLFSSIFIYIMYFHCSAKNRYVKIIP